MTVFFAAALFAGKFAARRWAARRWTAARWGFRYLAARKAYQTARRRRPSGRKRGQHPHRYKRQRR